MSVSGDVLAMQCTHFRSKSLDECFLDVFMYEDIVGSDACLAAVKGLAPCKSLCRNRHVCRLVDDARALSSKLQNYRCEVLCCSSHDCLGQCRASCEEDHVPALLKECCVNFPVALNDRNVLLLKGFLYHILDY